MSRSRTLRRIMPASPRPVDSIRITLFSDSLDADGLPRAGLMVPQPTVRGRRPMLLLFPSVALALQAKQQMEGGAG